MTTKKPTLEMTAATVEQPAVIDNIVTDAKGRVLKVVEPDVLAESRLMRMVGPEAALNPAYMRLYVMPAVSVVEIDGEEMGFPLTQREVDAAISRLGHEGINAVLERNAAKKKKEEEDAAVKN
jgi:DNA-binding transcriptional LysR family regulator